MRGLTTTLLCVVACLGVTVQGQRQVFPGTADLPFSAATKADGLIYVAGTIVAKGDIKAQTKAVLDSMAQTLTKAGSSMPQVAAVHVYIKNASDFAAIVEHIEAGEFPPRPQRPGDCQWCRYALVCRKEYAPESDEATESV